MTNTGTSLIQAMRAARSLIVGAEMDCRIHSVRRVGDTAHAVISVDALTEGGRRVWTSGRMAVLLDTIDGTRPVFRGRTESAARRIRILGMALGRKVHALAYWVDSSAHFWCAGNAPHLYRVGAEA